MISPSDIPAKADVELLPPTPRQLGTANGHAAGTQNGHGIDVRFVCETGVEHYEPEDLSRLLKRDDGVVWVDIPVCDETAVPTLTEVFGFHRIAVRDCVERNHVSKVHVYADHVFVVLHSPQVGLGGHVHYVELDQFIGVNYLVTVHGPLNPAVDPQISTIDTETVLRRIEQKHLQVSSPFELSRWIVSSLIRRELDLVANLAKESGRLEQRVTVRVGSRSICRTTSTPRSKSDSGAEGLATTRRTKRRSVRSVFAPGARVKTSSDGCFDGTPRSS
jgi:hypothetical protein